jgi:hypothetical protein
MVLAKHLDRLIRWRSTLAIEFRQTSFARCHAVILQSHASTRLPSAPRFPLLSGDSSLDLNGRMRFRCDMFWPGSHQIEGSVPR